MPQLATTNVTAGSIMDLIASLMNDTAKTVFTYDAQLPYFRMSCNELQEYLQLNNVSVTEQTSALITIPIGTTEVKALVDELGANASPNYPANLVEIEQIWERLAESSDPFIPVSRQNFLPHYLDGITPGQGLIFWAWQDQIIKFLPASTAREIKLDYIKTAITGNVTSDSIIGVINSGSFLMYRTAALCAEFIGENPTRAASLNGNAQMAIDRMTGINIKGQQGMGVRRKPFQAGYKSRDLY